MSASIKIELCDERGNRAVVTMEGHENQYVGAFIEDAEKLAACLLEKVRTQSAPKGSGS